MASKRQPSKRPRKPKTKGTAHSPMSDVSNAPAAAQHEPTGEPSRRTYGNLRPFGPGQNNIRGPDRRPRQPLVKLMMIENLRRVERRKVNGKVVEVCRMT